MTHGNKNETVMERKRQVQYFLFLSLLPVFLRPFKNTSRTALFIQHALSSCFHLANIFLHFFTISEKLPAWSMFWGNSYFLISGMGDLLTPVLDLHSLSPQSMSGWQAWCKFVFFFFLFFYFLFCTFFQLCSTCKQKIQKRNTKETN